MHTKILEMSINELRSALDKKEFSSVDVTKAYLNQIEKVDSVIGAYLYINKEAIKQAELIDKKRMN